MKLSNILIKNSKVKLTDFGTARFTKNQKTSTLIKGTRFFLPPELLEDCEEEEIKLYTSTKQDIWALGIIIHQLFSNLKHPFKHGKGVVFNVMNDTLKMDEDSIPKDSIIYEMIKSK